MHAAGIDCQAARVVCCTKYCKDGGFGTEFLCRLQHSSHALLRLLHLLIIIYVLMIHQIRCTLPCRSEEALPQRKRQRSASESPRRAVGGMKGSTPNRAAERPNDAGSDVVMLEDEDAHPTDDPRGDLGTQGGGRPRNAGDAGRALQRDGGPGVAAGPVNAAETLAECGGRAYEQRRSPAVGDQHGQLPAPGGSRGRVAADPSLSGLAVDEDKPSPAKQRHYRSVTDIDSGDPPHAANAHAGADSKRQRRDRPQLPSEHSVSDPAAKDSRPSAQHSEPAAARGGDDLLSDEDDGSQVRVAERRSSAGMAPGRMVVKSGEASVRWRSVLQQHDD